MIGLFLALFQLAGAGAMTPPEDQLIAWDDDDVLTWDDDDLIQWD